MKGAQSDSVSATSIPKIGLHPSEHCENVLQRILVKTSGSNQKAADLGMRKWDTEPFIVQKKSRLANYALQQLKDAIFTGSHSFLESLKEQSGLSVGNKSQFGVQVDEDNHSSIMTKLEGSHKSTQIAGNDQLTSPAIVDSNRPLHRNLVNENLPVKRIRSATTENNAGGKSSKGWIIAKNGCKIRLKFSRKQKHDIISSEQDLGGKLASSSVSKQLADTSITTARNSENKQENQIEEAKGDKDCSCDGDRTSIVTKKNASLNPHFTYSPDYLGTNWRKLNLLADMCTKIVESRCSLSSSICLGDIGRDRPPGDGNIGFSSPKGLLGHEEGLNCEKHVIDTDPKSTNENLDEKHVIDTDHKLTNENLDEKHVIDTDHKSPNENLDEEHGQDNEGFHEFGTANEDGKHEITSSKGIDSHKELSHREKHDSNIETKLQNENLDEEHKQDHGIENVCDLEFTSSEKLIGHEKFLHCEKPDEEPTDVNMDKFEKNIQRDLPNIGNAEEDVDFSSDSEGHRSKRSDIAREKNGFLLSQCTYSQCSLATTDLRELSVCVKCNKGGNLLVCSSKPCPLMIHERCLGFDASFDTAGRFYCPFCEYSQAISKYDNIKKKVSLTRKDFSTFICSGAREEQCRRSYRMKQHHLEQDDGLNNKDINSCLHKRKVVDSGNGTSHKLDKDKIENTENKTADAQEVSEEENRNCGVSKHFIRVQKRKRKSSNPAIPKLRRKRIAWTTAEEGTLREGMQRFCSPHDPYIPWKKILEFGADVFHKNRSTIDLKDKWRNLCKASPNC